MKMLITFNDAHLVNLVKLQRLAKGSGLSVEQHAARILKNQLDIVLSCTEGGSKYPLSDTQKKAQ